MSRNLLILLLFIVPTAILPKQHSWSQANFPPRKKLVAKIQTEEFARVVEQIRSPDTKMISDVNLKRSDIYFRLTERKYVLTTENQLNRKAALGGSPYVFLTVPQAGFGRSLYEIYSDLGYDAEGILKQRGTRMVALVIRYKSNVKFSEVTDGGGTLKREGFDRYIYVPTWKNAFSLFAELAGDTAPDPENPMPMKFSSEANRKLATYFPADKRKHIAQLPYSLIRAAGGPDWNYRQLLETKMSMNSHFRGVGMTENTLSPADNRKGLPEFVGPNRVLDGLEEFAVIDMGSMEFVEVHQ